jgi:hypothetical protein
MADMGKEPGSKPWWESRLDWTLPESLETTLRMGRDLLRNIPQTLSAYNLGKTSPLDELEPDPIERIGSGKRQAQTEATKVKVARAPIVVPPPPPPPVQWGIRAINMPPASSKPVWMPLQDDDTRELYEPEVESMQQRLKKLERTLQETIAREEEKNALCLEQLLDPEFCDYVEKKPQVS